MAIKGIFNADGVTTYTVADVKKINSKFINGKIIYGDNDLRVSAQTTPNMSVKVSSGSCSINDSSLLENTSSYNISIASNSSSYPRKDAIVAYISGTTYSLRILQGTPSVTPSAPSTSASYYVKLAEVTVGVGVTSIQESNIKDCRKEDNQKIINSLIDEIHKMKNDYKHDANGFDKFPSGLILKWGTVTAKTKGGGINIVETLNEAFPTKGINGWGEVRYCGNDYTAVRMNVVVRVWNSSVTIIVQQVAGTIVADNTDCEINWWALGV